MHESNENQGNPVPSEREQEEAATPRKQEHDAMQAPGHDDPPHEDPAAPAGAEEDGEE